MAELESGHGAPARVLNLNLGVLGHVDSGKTCLVKALSTTLSTAALDKLPQSQQRGITLDLGFSSFSTDLPPHVKERLPSEYGRVQFTLVDCPGHATLIRTIIGGAQIIDVMLLVIDAKKGVQTQTAECLVLAEILVQKLIVVINKCDLVSKDELDKIKSKLRDKVFKGTKFGKDVVMVCVTANPGGSDAVLRPERAKSSVHEEAKDSPPLPDVKELIEELTTNIAVPFRDVSSPFAFAVDHCFAIGGKGTILTGTVLSGSVGVNDSVELPALGLERKVKAVQMFRQPVQRAHAGDRAALCVTQLDPKLMERGLVCQPNTVCAL